MRHTVLLSFVLVAIYAGQGLAQDHTTTESPETTTFDVSTQPVSTATSTKKSTFTSASTTDQPTTTQSPNKTSTSTHSYTTTQSPNKTSASTHSYTTTEISTAVPSTAAPPPADIYAVGYGNGNYCILLQANISVTLSYISTTDNKSSSGVVYVPPAAQTHVSGNCSLEFQHISISFFDSWNLVLYLTKNGTKYHLSKMQLNWDMATSKIAGAPNVSGTVEDENVQFETSKAGYTCLARTTIYSKSSVVNNVSAVYTEKLKLEAFQNKKATFSDQYDRCSADNISNLVPIIVGACLGGLILIVLIAYLIGRKRSRRGYESV